MIKKETGFNELPKLAAEDAIKIAKKYYADIGIDLDKPPYAGKMYFDTKKRENKYPNAFAETLGDGSRTWLNTNFDPKEEISLDDLDTIIHEMGHDINMIAGSKNAGGNVSMNAIAAQTSAFAEGFAITMGNRVYDALFMDKYLAPLPQFSNPKTRSAISRVKRMAMLYEDMKIMVRARQEIELYLSKYTNGNYRDIKERIFEMTNIARKYLFVETQPDKLDFWSIPHHSGNNLYYSNYSLGRFTAALACKDIIDAMNGLRPTENAAKLIIEVFHEGAKLFNLEMIRKFAEERLKK
jgi:oligoendopeptidase F